MTRPRTPIAKMPPRRQQTRAEYDLDGAMNAAARLRNYGLITEGELGSIASRAQEKFEQESVKRGKK